MCFVWSFYEGARVAAGLLAEISVEHWQTVLYIECNLFDKVAVRLLKLYRQLGCSCSWWVCGDEDIRDTWNFGSDRWCILHVVSGREHLVIPPSYHVWLLFLYFQIEEERVEWRLSIFGPPFNLFFTRPVARAWYRYDGCALFEFIFHLSLVSSSRFYSHSLFVSFSIAQRYFFISYFPLYILAILCR